MTFDDIILILGFLLLLFAVALLLFQGALRFILTIHLRAIDLQKAVEKVDGQPLTQPPGPGRQPPLKETP